jgi:PhnB protein
MADQGVIPMLAYEDGPAAMDWLVRAFGFKEKERRLDQQGRLSHGELDTGSGLVMLATPTPAYRSPRHHRQECEAARRWSEVPYIVDGVLVYVEDVAAHHRRAVEAGAQVLTPPDTGQARYRVEDLEGHRWMFMKRGAAG